MRVILNSGPVERTRIVETFPFPRAAVTGAIGEFAARFQLTVLLTYCEQSTCNAVVSGSFLFTVTDSADVGCIGQVHLRPAAWFATIRSCSHHQDKFL